MYISLVIKEMQIKTTVKYSQPSVRQKFKDVIIPGIG